MSWEIGFTLATIAVAFALFLTERYRIDQVALLVPVILLLGGVIDAEQAVSGFSHPATVTIAAMLVLSLGLVKTGGVDAIGRWIRRAPLGSPRLRAAALCAVVGLVSPFLNNTAVVAIFLPLFLELSAEAGDPPSRYLIPLSYAAILGGTITLIGTSTNLIVWGMAENRGYTELGLFSIAPVGLVYLAVGLAYMALVGRFLLPDRPGSGELPARYGVREFDGELEVPEGAACIGRSLVELGWDARYGVTIRGIGRRGRLPRWSPGEDTELSAGDIVFVNAGREELLAFAEKEGLAVTPSLAPRAGARGPEDDTKGEEAGTALVELLVTPGSSAVGRPLADLRTSGRDRAEVLAIHRHGAAVRGKMADIRLRGGDLLLARGASEDVVRLVERFALLLLGPVRQLPTGRPRALVATGILAGVITVAALGWVSIFPAALVGVTAIVFTGSVTLDELYRELDWTVVFLLAGLIPLGVALEESGAGLWLAEHLHSGLVILPTVGVIAGFYLFTSLLTEIVTNNASAVVLTPIALYTAADLGMSPYPLLVAIMFGASASFMTPMGYQTNTMVYGPGGYRFTDFLRVGAPLNLILLVVASVLIPVFWSP